MIALNHVRKWQVLEKGYRRKMERTALRMLSEEEPKAPEDDATAALERLPKLKLGAKGSSKGDKQRDKNKNKNKEEKKHKARRKVQSSPQPSSESENGDDDGYEYYAQRLPKRTLKSNTKRSY